MSSRGCPQWEQYLCLLDATSLCVLLPLCIIFWGTLGCNCTSLLFIALSQSSDNLEIYILSSANVWLVFILTTITFLIWATFCTCTERKEIYVQLISLPKLCEDNLNLDNNSRPLILSQILMPYTLQADSTIVVSMTFFDHLPVAS